MIPRVGQAALPLRASIGRMVTGFSDRVDLGSFGDIESDRSVVMRVYLADEWLDPATLPGLRWRGVAFDQFDGRTWSSAAAPRRFMHRTVTGDFGLGLPRGTGPVVRQEIYLEPIGSDAVFAAPRAVRLEIALAHPGGGRHGRPHRVESRRPPALRRRVRDREPRPPARCGPARRRPR